MARPVYLGFGLFCACVSAVPANDFCAAVLFGSRKTLLARDATRGEVVSLFVFGFDIAFFLAG